VTENSKIIVEKEVISTKIIGRCENCNRAAFDKDKIGKKCCFPQPNGNKCQGHFIKI
jgi:hypothetical protein